MGQDYEFERSIVSMFNTVFEDGSKSVRGRAYRRRSSKFSSQVCDVLVDSASDRFYGAVECKRVSSSDKLYFSSNFRSGQVEDFRDFCRDTGRSGWLAVEVSHGRGRAKQGFLMDLETLLLFYENGKYIPLNLDGSGEGVSDGGGIVVLGRKNGDYILPEDFYM